MKLTELKPTLFRYESRIETWNKIVGDHATWHERGQPVEPVTGPREYWIDAKSLDDAQGILFLCPKCFQSNNGEIGTHEVQVTFANRNVIDEHGVHNGERPVRWNVEGSNFDDITISPSILIIGGCEWHGFIQHGEIIHA